jgi:hypothetical protein
MSMLFIMTQSVSWKQEVQHKRKPQFKVAERRKMMNLSREERNLEECRKGF